MVIFVIPLHHRPTLILLTFVWTCWISSFIYFDLILLCQGWSALVSRVLCAVDPWGRLRRRGEDGANHPTYGDPLSSMVPALLPLSAASWSLHPMRCENLQDRLSRHVCLPARPQNATGAAGKRCENARLLPKAYHRSTRCPALVWRCWWVRITSFKSLHACMLTVIYYFDTIHTSIVIWVSRIIDILWYTNTISRYISLWETL